MNRKYTIKPHIRYHNIIQDVEVHTPGKDVCKFDSTFEYNIYKLLRNKCKYYNMLITVHPYFICPGVRWKVDFLICAYDSDARKFLGKLLKVCNQTYDNMPVTSIYIECKGVLNDKFIKTLDTIYSIAPRLADNLIIVGSAASAYTKEVPEEEKIYIKPVVSCNTFEEWLKKT